MALIPTRTTVARGIVGTWANMEEDNARTGFAGAEFAAGVPVMKGTGDMVYVPLEDGGRFAGIALRSVDMDGTPTADGEATFSVGQLFGIADMGTVYVLAGDDVTEGANVFYDPAPQVSRLVRRRSVAAAGLRVRRGGRRWRGRRSAHSTHPWRRTGSRRRVRRTKHDPDQ